MGSLRRIFSLCLLISLFGAAPARAQNVLYFDYPDGAELPYPANGVNELLRADRTTRIHVKKRQTDRNGQNYFLADIEYIDAKGKRQLIQDVSVMSEDTRPERLPATRITITRPPADIRKEDCPPNGAMAPPGNLRALARELPGKEMPLETALRQFRTGECLKEKTGGAEKNLYRSTMGEKCRKMNTSPNTALAFYNDRAVGSHDLCAIESMARTLYGEMRSCNKFGLRYPMAVAKVMWNRAVEVGKKGFTDTFVSRTSDHLKERLGKSPAGYPPNMIIPHISESDSQFSAWNRGDPNNGEVLCPNTNSKEWKDALDVAAATVLEDPSFMKLTAGITVKHYTSGMAAPWKGAREVNGVTVSGTPVDKKSCIRFWEFPNQK